MKQSGAELSMLLRSLSGKLPMLDAQRAGVELYGAPRLNAFSLFNPGENTISRIVQDILDPLGSHGQGSLFLNSLLVALGQERVDHGAPIQARREVRTSEGRRIDLVIETPTVLLGIENKPWAAQQPRQLADYLDALRQWCGAKTPVLVFLSDQEPQSAIGEAVVVPFVDDDNGLSLRSILSTTTGQIKAPRTRTHIEELISYLDEQFGDGELVDPGDEPYVEAVESEFSKQDHRRAIAAVMLSHKRVHSLIIDEIGKYLLHQLGPGFETSNDCFLSDAIAQRYRPWTLRKANWPENLALALEAHSPNQGNVYFGVRAPTPKDPEIKREGAGCVARHEVEKAVSGVEGGGKTKWWPWWAYPISRNWTPEFSAKLILHSPTAEPTDHPEITLLVEKFVSLAACVDRAVS